MRSLSLPLLIFFISLTAQQAPTGLPKCETKQILALAVCIPMINEFKGYSQTLKIDKLNSEAIRNMTILCDRAAQCLSVNKCQESDNFKKTLEKSCDMLDYLGDPFHCLTEFFKEAYSSNGSPTCFQKYDFLEKVLSKKREAFENGKSCFTDYVKDYCNKTSIDFFSKNYQKFVNDISIKPNDTDGQNPHKVLNMFRCNALGKQIQNEILELHALKMESNDTRIPKMNKMCKDMQDCASEYTSISLKNKQKIEHTCSLFETVNQGSFTDCTAKLMGDEPDLSDYKCLEGLDFYDSSNSNVCKKVTTKKECFKKIMGDKCGKEAVVDFDKIVERVAKVMEC
ncbi:unnamed protein product [Caenorhabditis nigoni]